jgi:hypothetical protein
LTKLDAGGRLLWYREVSPGKLVLSALSVDYTDHVVAAGTFVESVDFGQGPITLLPGLQGLFLAKYSP